MPLPLKRLIKSKKMNHYNLTEEDEKIVKHLIDSGNYRIKVTHRIPPMWTIYEPQVAGMLWGWNTINTLGDAAFDTYSVLSEIQEAKYRILKHYSLNNVTVEYIK